MKRAPLGLFLVLSVLSCREPPPSIAAAGTAKSVLVDARKVAASLVDEGQRTRDPVAVRVGTELELSAGNAERCVGNVELTIGALPEDARHLLADLRRDTRVAGGYRAGPWDLQHAATVDVRDESDAYLKRDVFLVREVRGAAALESPEPRKISLIASGVGLDPEGRTAVEVTVGARKLAPVELGRTIADQLDVTVPAATLDVPPDTFGIVPVKVSVTRSIRKGEWPFHSWEPATHEIAFRVVVLPRKAGTMHVEAKVPRSDGADDTRSMDVDVAWGQTAAVPVPADARALTVRGRLANGEDVWIELPGGATRGLLAATLEPQSPTRRLTLALADLRLVGPLVWLDEGARGTLPATRDPSRSFLLDRRVLGAFGPGRGVLGGHHADARGILWSRVSL